LTGFAVINLDFELKSTYLIDKDFKKIRIQCKYSGPIKDYDDHRDRQMDRWMEEWIDGWMVKRTDENTLSEYI